VIGKPAMWPRSDGTSQQPVRTCLPTTVNTDQTVNGWHRLYTRVAMSLLQLLLN